MVFTQDEKTLAYCVKCKKKVEVTEGIVVEIKTVKGTRNRLKGKCLECGGKVSVFIKKSN